MHNKTTAQIFNEADLSKVSREDMHRANDILSDFVEHANMPEKAHKMKMHLMILLNDSLPYDVVKCVVDKFINEDGTKGEHWDYATTKSVRDSLGYDFDCVEWYYALNKVYSDYYSPDFADEVYFKMACQYLKDKDGGSDKVKHDILMML